MMKRTHNAVKRVVKHCRGTRWYITSCRIYPADGAVLYTIRGEHKHCPITAAADTKLGITFPPSRFREAGKSLGLHPWDTVLMASASDGADIEWRPGILKARRMLLQGLIP